MGGNVTYNGVKPSRIYISKNTIDLERLDILALTYMISKDFYHHSGGRYLFGSHSNLDCFTGSTAHLIHGIIPDEELVAHKSSFGDVDIQADARYKYQFEDFLAKDPVIWGHRPVHKMKHGNEISVIFENMGRHTQYDFQFVDHPGSSNEQFLHSAPWEDIKLGFKGAHHKLLLNAIGLDNWKFSIMGGLSSRLHNGPSTTNPDAICSTLFGTSSSHHKDQIHSFVGLCYLIDRFKHPSEKDAILSKFWHDCQNRIKDYNSNVLATMHLAKAIGSDLLVG